MVPEDPPSLNYPTQDLHCGLETLKENQSLLGYPSLGLEARGQGGVRADQNTGPQLSLGV